MDWILNSLVKSHVLPTCCISITLILKTKRKNMPVKMDFLLLKPISTILANLKNLITLENLKLKLLVIEKILLFWTEFDQLISDQSEEHKHIPCCSSKNPSSILRRVKIFFITKPGPAWDQRTIVRKSLVRTFVKELITVDFTWSSLSGFRKVHFGF